MAHRIIGLDIGARSIKAAVIDKALRKTAMTAVDREDIAIPGDPEAIQAALSKILGRNRQSADDVISTGIPMSQCVHRILRFPFGDEEAIKESVVFELESHIPIDVDDLVIDHLIVGKTEDDQTAVMCIAAQHSYIRDRLEMMRAATAEPRVLPLSALSYATLLGNLPSLREGRNLVIDIGAESSEVVIVEDGLAKWARSMSVGSETVREEFAAKFDTTGVQTDLLQTHCMLLPPNVPPSQPSEQVLHAATVDALLPLMREIRITLAAARKDGVSAPERVVLTGGMAGMRGLVEYLERALRLPVSTIDVSELEIAEGMSRPDERCGLAVALALQATELRTQDGLDFRQGEFAFEGDFKFLRQRIPQIAAFCVIALCLLGVRTTVNFRALVHEQQRQKTQLVKLSKALTSKRIASFTKLKKELKRPLSVDLASYYPDISAIRTFEELSKIIEKVTEPPDFSGPAPTLGGKKPGGPKTPRAPGAKFQPAGGIRAAIEPPGDEEGAEEGSGEFEGHKVELLSTDIDRTKGSLRGDCDTQDALLAFQEALTRHACFHKVKSSSDRITFQRHKDWFRFNIRFEIHCPDDDEDQKKAAEAAKKGKSAGGKKEAE